MRGVGWGGGSGEWGGAGATSPYTPSPRLSVCVAEVRFDCLCDVPLATQPPRHASVVDFLSVECFYVARLGWGGGLGFGGL